MIYIKEGNVLYAKEEIIGVQVNCMAHMNGFDALQIKLAYPKVYDAYRLYCEANQYTPEKLLGTMMPIWVNNKCVVSLFGQDTYGHGRRFTNYKALLVSLKRLKGYCQQLNRVPALPWGIGCKDAGGDWDIIYNMLGHVFEDWKVSLYMGGDW